MYEYRNFLQLFLIEINTVFMWKFQTIRSNANNDDHVGTFENSSIRVLCPIIVISSLRLGLV